MLTDLASRLAAMREAAQGGAASGIQGGDTAQRITVDIGAGQPSSFGDALTRVLNDASATQDRASDAVNRFVRGEHVEMHEVMAATEEAGIALEMLVELRNKVTDAYRSLINMQS
jgi:flagellar hook-basal body complex protein FliE